MKKEKFKVPFIVDNDKKTRYERPSLLVKILRLPLILILNLLPKNLDQKIFLAFSKPSGNRRTIYNNVATYKALEVLYTFPFLKAEGKTSLLDDFWNIFLNNVRALRNRLRLVKRLLTEAIDEEIKKGKAEIEILSLGSGSARAIIEAIAPFNGKVKFNIKLIELSREAIRFSKELAQKYGLDGSIKCYCNYAQNLERYYPDSNPDSGPDIVEMVGLLDYYPYLHAVDLLSKIHKVLAPGGLLITCNISPNLEAPFITKGINWTMIYRNSQELTQILIEGGFSPSSIRIICEPMKIHIVAIAKKNLV